MRLIGCAFALAALPCMLSAQSTSRTYWLMTRDDGLWCGYKNEAEFKAKVDKAPPLESAKVTYVSDTLREVTYQAQAESGDWIVIDQYTLTDTGTMLRRANVFAGQQFRSRSRSCHPKWQSRAIARRQRCSARPEAKSRHGRPRLPRPARRD